MAATAEERTAEAVRRAIVEVARMLRAKEVDTDEVIDCVLSAGADVTKYLRHCQSIVEAMKDLIRDVARLVADPSNVASFNSTVGRLKAVAAALKEHESADTLILREDKKQVEARRQVLLELVVTERDYVEDLVIMQGSLQTPMLKLGLVSPQDSTTLFSNIDQLVSFNAKLLRELEARVGPELLESAGAANPQRRASVSGSAAAAVSTAAAAAAGNTTFRDDDGMNSDLDLLAGTGRVGDVFERAADFLKMYTHYCSTQPLALVRLSKLQDKEHGDEKLRSFLADRMEKDPLLRGLPLNAYLIKPVQRVCKYPLLLAELRKHTPEGHPDHEPLARACDKVDAVVAVVNEKKRQFESQQAILDIQAKVSGLRADLVTPTRLFVREGHLDVAFGTHSPPYTRAHVFVFNDLVLVTVKQAARKLTMMLATLASRGGERSPRYTLKAQFPLHASRINAVTAVPASFQLEQHAGDGSLVTLLAPNDAERDDWQQAIQSQLSALRQRQQSRTGAAAKLASGNTLRTSRTRTDGGAGAGAGAAGGGADDADGGGGGGGGPDATPANALDEQAAAVKAAHLEAAMAKR